MLPTKALWGTNLLLLLSSGFVVNFFQVSTQRQLTSSSLLGTSANTKAVTNTSSTVQEKDKKVHWCVISANSSSGTAALYSAHFPHAAENILPCWSWFMRQNATDRCGFVFIGPKMRVRLPHPGTLAPKWQEQLVNAMGCQVKELDNAPDMEKPLGNDKDVLVQHTVPLQVKLPRYQRIMYMERIEDATALRRLFVPDEWIDRQKRGRLQVGLIQRTKSRAITNLNDIVSGLEKALPDADFNVTILNTPWLQEQAEWFATKDVIVASHGAALTNAAFCTTGTIVMQLYSDQYYWPSLEPLIESTGAVALDWWYGSKPEMAAHWRVRNQAREANITPPVEEIVDPILYALGRKPHSRTDLLEQRHVGTGK